VSGYAMPQNAVTTMLLGRNFRTTQQLTGVDSPTETQAKVRHRSAPRLRIYYTANCHNISRTAGFTRPFECPVRAPSTTRSQLLLGKADRMAGLKASECESEIDMDRVHPRIGSGRVGSGWVTGHILCDFDGSGRAAGQTYFYRILQCMCIIFHCLYSCCHHLIDQDSTD